jgi:hypothetical protein
MDPILTQNLSIESVSVAYTPTRHLKYRKAAGFWLRMCPSSQCGARKQGYSPGMLGDYGAHGISRL